MSATTITSADSEDCNHADSFFNNVAKQPADPESVGGISRTRHGDATWID